MFFINNVFFQGVYVDVEKYSTTTCVFQLLRRVVLRETREEEILSTRVEVVEPPGGTHTCVSFVSHANKALKKEQEWKHRV